LDRQSAMPSVDKGAGLRMTTHGTGGEFGLEGRVSKHRDRAYRAGTRVLRRRTASSRAAIVVFISLRSVLSNFPPSRALTGHPGITPLAHKMPRIVPAALKTAYTCLP
jgi:hypothetical protein